MGLFSSFLGLIGNNQEAVSASVQIVVFHALPAAIQLTCLAGGVYGLPAYFGLNYAKGLGENARKNYKIKDISQLITIIEGYKSEETKEYAKKYITNKGINPKQLADNINFK